MPPGTPPLSLIPPNLHFPVCLESIHFSWPPLGSWCSPRVSPLGPCNSLPVEPRPFFCPSSLNSSRSQAHPFRRSGHHIPQLLILQRLLVTLRVRSALLTGRAGSAQPSELMSTLHTALQTFCLIAHSCFWAFAPALPSVGIPYRLPRSSTQLPPHCRFGLCPRGSPQRAPTSPASFQGPCTSFVPCSRLASYPR